MTLKTQNITRDLLYREPLTKCWPSTQRSLSRAISSSEYASSMGKMKLNGERKLKTRILPVDARKLGKVTALPIVDDILDEIDIQIDSNTSDSANLRLAAEQLRNSNIPVAFPTETVYGLGADATRSAAVNGIYAAKQRPADNPLIVHFASLRQLRALLRPSQHDENSQVNGHTSNGNPQDPIPDIYKPLISKFWPGPLTIILPNPANSSLAPEVTAGLNTFGARMPRHVLALALIQMADRPIAAPSANASTKPSPTAAEHVAYDLNSRIETIIDGGPCDVGVESTVVDGLSQPPLILRPGGVSLEQLRSCPGWENTQIGYKNAAEHGSQPTAPGMKYRHYSPRAPVVLYESDMIPPSLFDMSEYLRAEKRLGIIATKRWKVDEYSVTGLTQSRKEGISKGGLNPNNDNKPGFAGMISTLDSLPDSIVDLVQQSVQCNDLSLDILTIDLGDDTANIARGIFSALRELDRKDVDAIFVEGINEREGDTAAAVMNRLRKAAEINLND